MPLFRGCKAWQAVYSVIGDGWRSLQQAARCKQTDTWQELQVHMRCMGGNLDRAMLGQALPWVQQDLVVPLTCKMSACKLLLDVTRRQQKHKL